MELGFEERAVDTCRKILEISPRMKGLIESMVEKDELRRKIFE